MWKMVRSLELANDRVFPISFLDLAEIDELV